MRIVQHVKSGRGRANPNGSVVDFDGRQLRDLFQINDARGIPRTEPNAHQQIGTAGKPGAGSTLAEGRLSL
jgi:hypothetical protein